jgi:hypothetical protein
VLDLSIENLNLSTFLHQLLKNPVAEMLTAITYDCLRGTKTSKEVAKGVWDGSYKVNAPHIKNLNNHISS